MGIGDNIREHRAGKKISQEELAEVLHVNREYISQLENNKASERADVIIRIGEFLNCTVIKRYGLGLKYEEIRLLLQ